MKLSNTKIEIDIELLPLSLDACLPQVGERVGVRV
jgi:hypothetical protein